MRLISWNVNGLRACVGKGFQDFFFCILATSSMCLVLDRKNFLDGAEIYGKNTRFVSHIKSLCIIIQCLLFPGLPPPQ